jgi:hypothetical protein
VGEPQLKAAIDYQESLGGRLLDILLRLGLVRKDAVDKFLRQLFSEQEARENTSVESDLRIEPEKLKVHRKLLEKVPAALVEKHQLLLFFPPPGTRAILMSAGRGASEDLQRQLQNLLGVDLYPVEIPDAVRARFLTSDRPPPAERPRPKETAPPAPPRPIEAEHPVLKALVNLLDRKQIVAKEELRVELELLRRRGEL